MIDLKKLAEIAAVEHGRTFWRDANNVDDAWSMAVSAVLAELERQGADLEGWRPIETAPKNGTFVLLSASGLPAIARWFETGWYSGALRMPSVTHWRPLPAPPAEEGRVLP